MRLSPGDLLIIDDRASVQFAGDRALAFRVVSVCDRPTYAGWVWLTGYVINRRGQATAKREIYVQLAGLRRAPDANAPARGWRHSVRAGPYDPPSDQGDGRPARDHARLRARADAR